MRVNPTLLLILLLAIVPFIASDSDGNLEFDMVCPTGTEGFSIINPTHESIDLKGWSVSDGEGKVSFNESMILRPKGTVTIVSDVPEDWMQLDDHVRYGESGVVNDRLNLNDKGDELYLLDAEGDMTHSFCYGDSTDPNPFQKIPKGHVALRNHAYGYPDETDEWILHVPGRTLYHFQRTYEDCEVLPFSFPESNGDEILAQIQDAKDTIRISIYTFDNKRVASALRDALERGVKVRMLVEGQPAGGVDSEQTRVLTALWRLGADIEVIHTQDSYKRYQYVHSKYAVIDDSTTIVTSENWTDSAFGNNRGWGVCVFDKGCAEYLSEVFDSDFTDKGDLTDFREMYATSLPYVLEPYERIERGFTTYIADVSPIVCPDYSYKSLKNFIQSAEYRIYSQQLNVQYDWTEGDDNPLQWMRSLGLEGVDSRLIVDVTYDSPDDDENEDGYGLYTIYRDDPSIQVRYFHRDISGLMHNKGIIVDDMVWIGSMNWTDNSITSNREMSVIVRSEEISGMYADLFIHDWGMEFDGIVDIVIETSDVEFGESVTLDASGSSVPFGSEFRWDLDNDGEYERTGTSVDWRFYDDCECTLRVIDPDGNVHDRRFNITLGEGIDDGQSVTEGYLLEGPVKYVPLIVIVLGIVLLRKLKGRIDANR